MLLINKLNTVLQTLSTNTATLVWDLLDGYYRKNILPSVLLTGQQEERVYDIVDAGPNNRFVVMTEHGEAIAHNCLGLQFGLGYKNLATKLTADTGRIVSEKEALELVDFHKKLFSKYWAWQDVQYNLYLKQKYLQLPNGWALLGDNDNSLSVKNFGVQGMGACIMQDAVLMMHEKYNAQIITPLHDAVYTLVPEGQVEQWKEIICYCMDQAVYKSLGDKVQIRLDVDVHRHGEPWVEEKGEQDYKILKKYLSAGETSADRFEVLTNTLYKRIN